MGEMVERVARAIAHSVVSDWNFAERGELSVDDKVDRDWREWEDDARAAISAMREPTEVMWTAGRGPILARDCQASPERIMKQTWYNAEKDTKPHVGISTKGDTAVWTWRAMIDAALEEEG